MLFAARLFGVEPNFTYFCPHNDRKKMMMKLRVKCMKCLCLAVALATMAGNAGAQDLKSVLGGIVKGVVGDKMTTSSSILGTWMYVGPECRFESDNLLAKAGGEVAARKVEERIGAIYDKLGLDGSTCTFSEDGSFSCVVKGVISGGTYAFDGDAKTVTMKTKLGIEIVAYVTIAGDTMSLVFNADKLMSVLKTVTGAASGANATASAINSLASTYDGLRLGFELRKK